MYIITRGIKSYEGIKLDESCLQIFDVMDEL